MNSFDVFVIKGFTDTQRSDCNIKSVKPRKKKCAPRIK